MGNPCSPQMAQEAERAGGYALPHRDLLPLASVQSCTPMGFSYVQDIADISHNHRLSAHCDPQSPISLIKLNLQALKFARMK